MDKIHTLKELHRLSGRIKTKLTNTSNSKEGYVKYDDEKSDFIDIEERLMSIQQLKNDTHAMAHSCNRFHNAPNP